VPADYQRRQTLKNAERFITPELKAFEDKALSAQERALAREKWLYEQLLDAAAGRTCSRCCSAGPRAGRAGRAGRLAERAATLNWCRPEFVPPALHRHRGRPPPGGAGAPGRNRRARFIANDCRLDARTRMLVITGPNMGGKSTFMRQVALIVLLAHGQLRAGQACRLGPIDAIHTRIGAADDLANAQSTFMLEMTEAAAIVHAPPHSLVLMDEIGRGTSTFDGLALAGAIASQLHDRNQAFTLFATHYFELTDFPAKHPRALNMHVGGGERGTTSSSCTIEPGPASRSYGVQVARLAGMPAALVRQARATLEALETQQRAGDAQVDLFAAPPA
jgi:DNA mismatch repair protein MutS